MPFSHLRVLASLSGLLMLAGAAAAQSPLPRVDTRADIRPQVRRDRDGNLVFRNQHLVAVLQQAGGGFGRIILYPATRTAQPASGPVAVVPEILTLGWRENGGVQTGRFIPTEARMIQGDRVELKGRVHEVGVSWETQVELWIGPNPWLSWEVTVSPSEAAELERFAPMPLLAGRAAPREALFPGIEYVEAQEPLRERLAPSPLQVTIPFMALSQNGSTVGMMWENRPNDARPAYPHPVFEGFEPSRDDPLSAVGPFVHRMQLFLPAAAPGAPLRVEARKELELSGKIVLLPEDGEPISVVRQWTEAYGFPRPAGYPRFFAAERKLSRQAYTQTLWRPEVPGWVDGLPPVEPPQPDPFKTLALLMDAGLTEEREALPLREQAQRVLDALRSRGALEPFLAYRTGGVLASLAAEREQVLAIIREQLPEGSWVFRPGSGIGGARHGGLDAVAAAALPVLRFAAITGDTTAAGSGARALEYIDTRYTLPVDVTPEPPDTAALEVPVGEQDLLTYANTAECFLLGYQISGERRYLENARYWADRALPLVFFWEDPTRPLMKHAALPTFGAGALPAQWMGLAYARVLRALNRVRPDAMYDFVSEGILANAMRQQYPSGEFPALLPERWNLETGEGEGRRLAPDPILAVMYRLMDLDMDVSHVRARVGPDRLFVASGATIQEASTSPFRLRLKLHWIEDHDTFTTIAGVVARPLSISYRDHPLRRLGIPISRSFLRETERESETGWFWDEEARLLILRLPHTGDEDWLEIRWPDPRERTPIERIDTRVRPRR